MAKKQYTIRSVPDGIDRELRRRAAEAGVSLNAVILEALNQAVGRPGEAAEHRDLDFLIGSWQEDSAFDEVVEGFSRIDESLWR